MKEYAFHQEKGKHCFVMPHPTRDDRVLKVFDYKEADFNDVDNFMWGDPPNGDNPRMNVLLKDATVIQNIAWLHGLAPRVYGIVKVLLGTHRYLAQEVECIGGEHTSMDDVFDVYEAVKKLGKDFGFKNEKDDVSHKDVYDGKLIDFNTFHFEENYLDKIKAQYVDRGRYGKIYYHNVPEWGLVNGPRDNEARIGFMGLDKINFKKKSVLDIGCAGGFFCRYAREHGADEVVGLDYKDADGSDPIFAASLASFVLGHHDINFRHSDIRDGCREKADVVFFLSMNYHVDIPMWLPKVTNEVCIFEDNSRDRDAIEKLQRIFNRVEKVGIATDHGAKIIYHCYK